MSSLRINARWAAVLERLRNNYWLMPSVMFTLALGLAFVSLAIDRKISEDPWKTGWLYMGGADGARSLLSSMAGATLTLAGVVFSMNLVSLTMASSQFGPRLLYNFVRDIGSQLTLGSFTAVFTFCMVVLREVKGEDGLADSFIPHLSVTIAGALSISSIGVLIYYVHHVAVRIQAPVVVANVGRELESAIKSEYRHKLEPGQVRTNYREVLAQRDVPDFCEDAHGIGSRRSGYVQAVDFDRLCVLASRYSLVLKLLSRPGQFTIEGLPLLQACPADRCTEKLEHELLECIVIGRRRTATQDIEFVVNELCEVAVRAMSPGINDPFTCIGCIDWLAAAMEELFQRDTPPGFLSDEEDNVRVMWHPVTHEGVMDSAFNQIRQFSAASPAVMTRLLEVYARLAGNTRTEEERAIVRKHADMAIRACRENFPEPNDLIDAEERHRKVLANLAAGGEI
jgi:uncharacterized membrane protein